ncbi:MAG: MORN repeat-containing protein [Acutalibacteraceae bacterium]
MEIDISKKLNKNAIFYAVYAFGETADDTDALCNVRQRYFHSGQRLKNKLSMNCDGNIYRYAFHIENGKPMKWRKLLNNKQVETAIATEDGYYVETYTVQRCLIKKTYFSFAHLWQKTEYFSETNHQTPTMTVEPIFKDSQIVLQKTDTFGKVTFLLPSANILDKELTDKLTVLGGDPEFICKTNEGIFFFCTEETHKRRQKSLQKLLKEQEEGQSFHSEQSAFEIDISKVESNDNPLDLTESQPLVLTEPKEEKISVENNIEQIGEEIKAEKMEEEEIQTEPCFIEMQPSEEIFECVNDTDKTGEKATESKSIKAVSAVSETSKIILPTNEQEESAEENDTKIPAAYSYERPFSNQDEATFCTFASNCPYKNISKQIIHSGENSYYYFGSLENDKRNGKGRTAMRSGSTAYEGGYYNGKRDGLGVYYYKSGKLCYAGHWKDNKRNGFGVAFSPKDGTVYVGKWEQDRSIGAGVSFDSSGNMLYMGKWSDGKKTGAGVTYFDQDDTVFVGKYKDGVFLGSGTQFNADGILIYSGGFKNGKRSGVGTSYDQNGSVQYTGTWKDGLYDGEGTLTAEDGTKTTGTFALGKLSGAASITDKNGHPIYTGTFRDGQYHGKGRIYLKDGYAEGEFCDGEMFGSFTVYNEKGVHVYTGTLKDGKPHGKGTEFYDSQKIYEGAFENGLYSGFGKLYEGGTLIYEGNFADGKRNGFGISYINEKPQYKGMWKDDTINGSGILFVASKAKFVGIFKNGKKDGRINELSGGKIIRQAIYHEDNCVYACVYNEKDGTPVYYGGFNLSGKREGMGCSFQAYCEKQFEGIFREDEPSKVMQVALKKLEPLPPCEELKDTEYERFSTVFDVVIEQSMCGGIYSGCVKGSQPEGKGTIMYEDHRFTGTFKNGKPSGIGIIYTAEGDEIKGSFRPDTFSGCKKIKFQNGKTYYYTVKN